MRHIRSGSLGIIIMVLLVGGSLRVAAIGPASGTLLPTMAATSAPTTAATPPVLHTIGVFTATVYYGPDKGLVLHGTLLLAKDKTGGLSGYLKRTGAPAVAVSGQSSGSALNLVFYVGADTLVFGEGSVERVRVTHRWGIGGVLVGPHAADVGEWTGVDKVPMVLGCGSCASGPGEGTLIDTSGD